MNYIHCPRRKNGSKIPTDVCIKKCPMKYYAKCEVNQEAYRELKNRYEQLKWQIATELLDNALD